MDQKISRKPELSFRCLSLLYLKDSPATAELCLEDLKEAGFDLSADQVSTREQFREKLCSRAYDIILSDYDLRNWSGIAALKVVQKYAIDTPFVFVNGAIEDDAIVESIKMGAADHVSRDRTARLSKAIRRVLEERDARAERKRVDEGFRASEVRYRMLFESARDGILILDAVTGAVLDANAFVLDLLGYSREEFLGKRLWEIGLFHDQENCRDSFRVMQENEDNRYDDLQVESKYGERLEIEFTTNVYWSEERRVIQCNIRDVTGRMQAAEQICQTKTFAAMSQLAGEVAQDLNVLSTAIAKYTELILEQADVESAAGSYLGEIREAGTRAIARLQPLLALECRPLLTLPQGSSFSAEPLGVEEKTIVQMPRPDSLPATGSETILLVEDDETARSLIRNGLQENGFTVLQGKGGQEALDVVRTFKGQIDLLLTEVVMPHISGFELADIIKEFRPKTKVLFVSGYTNLSFPGGQELDHETPFLPKPFTQAALNLKIREVLDSKTDLGKRAA